MAKLCKEIRQPSHFVVLHLRHNLVFALKLLLYAGQDRHPDSLNSFHIIQVSGDFKISNMEVSGYALRELIDQYWKPQHLFNFVITFSWIVFLWETFLLYRQYKTYRNSETVPVELAGVLDKDTFLKGRAYGLDKCIFKIYSSLWSQVLNTVLLVLNAIPLLWLVSRNTVKTITDTSSEILDTVMFVFLWSIISLILELPWTIYFTFVLEQKHGFNKQTPAFFAKDSLKKFLISQVFIHPIAAIAIVIIKNGGPYFFIYLWIFCSLVVLLFITIYADYIAPLFDNFVELPEGNLRSQIESLAASIEFPLTKLYVVEGSKRSSHSNAYFYGFYKNKRIVLFDTLLKGYVPKKAAGDANQEQATDVKPDETDKDRGCEAGEVLAVLAHELGHWKMNHVLKNLIIVEINLFFTFMVFGALYQNAVVYEAFGFTDARPVLIGLFIIFQYIFSPYNEILSFLMTCLTRRFEFQADGFAKHLNKASDLRSALIKLEKDNLGFPIYDWLFSAWHHSHPPLLERLKALGKID